MTHAGGAGTCERLSGSVVTSSVGDEMVVLDLESGLHHSPKEVGALIYSRLADGATRYELVAAVTERFDVRAEQAARDVEVRGGLVRAG